MDGGNFGAPPKPPNVRSNVLVPGPAPHRRAPPPPAPREAGPRQRCPRAARRSARRELRTRSPSSRPGLDDGGEQLAERGDTGAGRGRVVGAAVERLAGRGQETGHRPAALTGHRLRGRHVDGVDVGPLLAVHLDGDEAGVDLLGRRLVLERLVRHDVAPVAGGVADRQQHRDVAPRRLDERLVRPLPPVDGVVGVLQQVRARRVGEAVRHGLQPPRPERPQRVAPATSARAGRPVARPVGTGLRLGIAASRRRRRTPAAAGSASSSTG